MPWGSDFSPVASAPALQESVTRAHEKAAAILPRLFGVVAIPPVRGRVVMASDYGIRPIAFSLQEGQFGGIACGRPGLKLGTLTGADCTGTDCTGAD